jgi:hypothetical protein
MIDSIEISKLEYYNLLRDAEVLKRLEAGGVDNWTGYYDSVYGMEENEETMDDWEERTKKALYGTA